MTVAALRSTDLETASLNRPSTVPELLSELRDRSERIALLERELRAVRERNRVLIQARNDMTPPMGVVGSYTKPHQRVAHIVAAARACEQLGVVPAVRFVRDAQRGIIGVELAVMATQPETIDEGFRSMVRLAGMAVIE